MHSNNTEVVFISPAAIWRWVSGSGSCSSVRSFIQGPGLLPSDTPLPPRGTVFSAQSNQLISTRSTFHPFGWRKRGGVGQIISF